LFELTACNPAAEPLDALLGAAVGKTLGNDVALRPFLHPIVADLRRGVESFFDIALLQNATVAMRMVRPDARKAIRLQFEPNRQGIRFPLAGTALQRLNFPHDTEKILHMMADLVSDHVSLSEVTRRLKALAQFPVESKIDIDFLIFSAVKRARRRLAKSTGRLDGV
jgi:hypothetical protein